MSENVSLNEKEFRLISLIAQGASKNQRAISAGLGLSLGMTNLILRRLVSRGVLEMHRLTSKKVE